MYVTAIGRVVLTLAHRFPTIQSTRGLELFPVHGRQRYEICLWNELPRICRLSWQPHTLILWILKRWMTPGRISFEWQPFTCLAVTQWSNVWRGYLDVCLNRLTPVCVSRWLAASIRQHIQKVPGFRVAKGIQRRRCVNLHGKLLWWIFVMVSLFKLQFSSPKFPTTNSYLSVFPVKPP